MDVTKPSIPFFVDCKRTVWAVLRSTTLNVVGAVCNDDANDNVFDVGINVRLVCNTSQFLCVYFDCDRQSSIASSDLSLKPSAFATDLATASAIFGGTALPI